MASTLTLRGGEGSLRPLWTRSIKRKAFSARIPKIKFIRFVHRKAAIKLRVISNSFRHFMMIFHLKEFLSFPNIIILLPVAFDNLYQLILVQNWIRNCSVKDQYVYCCTQRKCLWSSEKIPIESNFERKKNIWVHYLYWQIFYHMTIIHGHLLERCDDAPSSRIQEMGVSFWQVLQLGKRSRHVNFCTKLKIVNTYTSMQRQRQGYCFLFTICTED